MADEKTPDNDVKFKLEKFYLDKIADIKALIYSDVFEKTEIGKIFNNIFGVYTVPLSEEDISGYLFYMYEDYKEITSNASFNKYLEDFMNLYFIFIEKYKDQIELYKFLEGEPNQIAKRLETLAVQCENVIGYLQHELNRYEVYHDMAITKIREVKTKAIKETHLSAPERLLVLDKIGFNELPFVKNLNDSEYKILISTILNYDKRSIDGYINGQKETSNESKYAITAKHQEEADKFLKQFDKK